MADESSGTPRESVLSPRVTLVGNASAALAIAIPVLVLLGYMLDVEFLRRPIPGYPAMHPITAICLALIGFAAAMRRRPMLALPATAAAGCLALLRLVDAALRSDLLASITPFAAILARQVDASRTTEMGVNTSVGLLAICAGQILAWRGASAASQVACCIGTMPFAIALMGYFYGVDAFHGVLVPATAVAGLLAAVASLAATADQGIMPALLGAGAPGRLARRLLVGLTAIMVLVGWMLAQFTDSANGLLLATEAVVSIAFLSGIVTFATVQFDRADRLRVEQEAELQRALLALRIGQADQAREARIFETTLEHIQLGILTIDADQTVVVCNSLASEMLDLPAKLMAARPPLADVLAHLRRVGEFDGTDAGRQDLSRAGKLPEQPRIWERQRPNGRVIEVRNVPLPDGGVVRTVNDITARRAPERRIIELVPREPAPRFAPRVAPARPRAAAGFQPADGAPAPWLESRGMVK